MNDTLIALTAFIEMIGKADDAYMQKNFPNLCSNGHGNVFTVDIGKKYARVIRSGAIGVSRSVHCFVNITNGDILKASGWKAPAPNGKRGSIFDADPMECMNEYGTKYLR